MLLLLQINRMKKAPAEKLYYTYVLWKTRRNNVTYHDADLITYLTEMVNLISKEEK